MNKNKFQPGQFRDKGWLYIPFNPKPMKNEHKMQYKSKLTYCYTHLPINDTPYSHESRLHASYKQRERTSAAKCFMATSRGSRGEKKGQSNPWPWKISDENLSQNKRPFDSKALANPSFLLPFACSPPNFNPSEPLPNGLGRLSDIDATNILQLQRFRNDSRRFRIRLGEQNNNVGPGLG